MLKQEAKEQERLVRGLKKKGLWSKKLDHILEVLVELVFALHEQLIDAFYPEGRPEFCVSRCHVRIARHSQYSAAHRNSAFGPSMSGSVNWSSAQCDDEKRISRNIGTSRVVALVFQASAALYQSSSCTYSPRRALRTAHRCCLSEGRPCMFGHSANVDSLCFPARHNLLCALAYFQCASGSVRSARVPTLELHSLYAGLCYGRSGCVKCLGS